jgi:hypothetical protein
MTCVYHVEYSRLWHIKPLRHDIFVISFKCPHMRIGQCPTRSWPMSSKLGQTTMRPRSRRSSSRLVPVKISEMVWMHSSLIVFTPLDVRLDHDSRGTCTRDAIVTKCSGNSPYCRSLFYKGVKMQETVIACASS